MLAQRDNLTPDQIWHLVNYIRHHRSAVNSRTN